MSGRRDSNSRPPAPKAGALTGLRYAPKNEKISQSEEAVLINLLVSFIQKAYQKGRSIINPKTNYEAVREGFEPSIPVSQYDSLANCWFQPLTHLT